MLAMGKKSRYCAKVTSPTANIGEDKSKWKHSMAPICESYMVSFATMAALWMKQTNTQEKGHCHLPAQSLEAVSKKHAKISSRILKQVPLNNVALLLRPNQTLVAVDAIFKKSTLFSE